MDKTININLGGTLFQIDENAYGKLKEYLQSISNKFKMWLEETRQLKILNRE